MLSTSSKIITILNMDVNCIIRCRLLFQIAANQKRGAVIGMAIGSKFRNKIKFYCTQVVIDYNHRYE